MNASRWIVAGVIATATALWACGGAEPTQPSGGGVTPTTTPTPIPTPTPTPTPTGYTLSLLFSNANAAVGEKVTAFVHANHDASAAKIGSFKANLVLDTSAVSYSGQVDRASDGLIAVNQVAPTIVGIVGAAFPQFSNDTLAAVVLTVKKAGALSSVILGMQELNTADFVSKAP